MKDERLENICYMCENDGDRCRYNYFIEQGKICPYFNAKYNCQSCSINCGDGMLCYKFDSKNIVKENSLKHPIEEKMNNLLINLMQKEKSTHDALIKFKQFLEANGIKADLSEIRLMGYINNLIALNTLDNLIKFYGLDDFRRNIIEKEIDRIFNPEREKDKNKKNKDT